MWECSPRCNAQVTQTPVPVTGQRVTLLQAVTTYKGTTRNFNTNLPVSPSYPGAPPPPPLPVPAKTPPPLLPQVDCEESFICSDSKSSESNCSSSETDSLNSDLIYSSENYILDDSSEHLRDTSRKCIPTSSQLIIPLESDDFLLERSSEVLEVDTVDISSEELEIKLNTIVEKPICNS